MNVIVHKNEVKYDFLASFSLFVVLAGIYLMPEKIKLFIFSSLIMMSLFVFLNRNVKFVISKLIYLWLLYCAFSIFILFVNSNVNETTIEIIITIFIGLFLSVASQKNIDVLKKSMMIFFYVSCIAVMGCLLQLICPTLLLKIVPHTLGPEKYASFYNFFEYNALVGFSYQTGVTGYYLCIFIISLLLFFLDTKTKSKKYLIIVFYLLGLYLLFMTGKRGELLFAILFTILYLFIYLNKHFVKLIFILGSLFTLIIILLLFTPFGHQMLERTFGDDPTSSRNILYTHMFNVFLQTPLFGVGIGSLSNLVPGFTNGHNIYLQLLAETGIVGLSIFIYVIVYNFKNILYLLRNDKENKLTNCFILFIMLHFILAGFIANPFYDIYPLISYLYVTVLCNFRYNIVFKNNFNNGRNHVKKNI